MAIKIYEVSAQFKSEKYPTLDTRISIVAAENEETAKKLALSNFFSCWLYKSYTLHWIGVQELWDGKTECFLWEDENG